MDYVERKALLKEFDEKHIQAIAQQKVEDQTENGKKHWKGIQSGINWGRNTIIEAPAANVAPIGYAYWDWQHNGTHFCSECGTNASYNYEGKEICSNWCPACGCFMTEVRDKE